MLIEELSKGLGSHMSENAYIELNAIYEGNDKYWNNTLFIGDLCDTFKTRKEREWLNRILTSLHKLRK